MKTASNPTGLESLFLAMSASLLLAAPAEALELEDLDPSLFYDTPMFSVPKMSLDGLGARTPGISSAYRTEVFVGHSAPQSGPALKRAQTSGKYSTVPAQGDSVGVYWRLSHDRGWHVDAMAKSTRFDASGHNPQGAPISDNARGVVLSVGGGFPIGLGKNWVIEPQAQVINQQYFAVGQATALDGQPGWSGRVGAKLSANYVVSGMPIQPFVRTNVWYDFTNAATLSLDKVDKISSGRNSPTVEVGLGLVARITPRVALFVSADYSSDVDDNDLNGLIGNLGVRVRW
ncbi:autotransporter outer membrane beta-barrel domain-containing protein [Pseudomonas sp. GD04058]|uniref:autotransporter outer membrane beta-barrel domain-containing protein n=1 Tax=Pseudomonas sp. GD04058 TaxID=2975429 RepID=UPI002446ACD2|nr:autotransporter outer membrane beta-barrel domain-containing protein [Pseudomonas sp. GD04058]MDG9883430.1 autotransporter outer membrane beta-barrel domain-containing protein [Pseudomonas sp. GD04058]